MNRLQLTGRVIVDAYGVSWSDITSRKRAEPLPVCRQLFCKLLHKTNRSTELAEVLNIAQDSVLIIVRTANEKIAKDPEFKADFEELETEILTLIMTRPMSNNPSIKIPVMPVTDRRNYFQLVIRKVCEACAVSMTDILGNSRKAEYVYARKMASYILMKNYRPSAIAHDLKVHRSCIYHYEDSMSSILDTYEVDRKKYTSILNDIEYETEFKQKPTRGLALATY